MNLLSRYTQCKYYPWVDNVLEIMIQVLFIFIFLTIFFFLYVVKVEEEAFSTQIAEVVNDILNEVDTSKITEKEERILALSALLEVISTKTTIQSQNSISSIEKANKKVFQKALRICLIFTVIVAILIFILATSGMCVMLTRHVIESLYVVLFVGLTEYFFLNAIAKKYKPIDAGKVKIYIAQAIKKYVNQRSPGPNVPLVIDENLPQPPVPIPSGI